MDNKLMNIGGDGGDVNYRYKMPVLIVAIESKGNGVKTCIKNIHGVAKALEIKVEMLLKYFSLELCAPTILKPDFAYINGQHSPGTLQKLLTSFIQTLVLCKTCKLPETNLVYKKSTRGTISQLCRACGALNIVKTSDKMEKFIIASLRSLKLK